MPFRYENGSIKSKRARGAWPTELKWSETMSARPQPCELRSVAPQSPSNFGCSRWSSPVVSLPATALAQVDERATGRQRGRTAHPARVGASQIGAPGSARRRRACAADKPAAPCSSTRRLAVVVFSLARGTAISTEDEASQTLGPYLIFRGLIPAPCSARSTAPIVSKLRCPAGVGSAVTHRKGRGNSAALAVVRADDLLEERVGPEGRSSNLDGDEQN